MRRVLIITMAAAWLVASSAWACRPPSDVKPPEDTPMEPVPLAPEAILEFQIPDTTDPKEPPSPFPEPTEDEEPVANLRGGAHLGHGGASPGSVEVFPGTTATTVTTTTATTSTTTTGSGIEVRW